MFLEYEVSPCHLSFVFWPLTTLAQTIRDLEAIVYTSFKREISASTFFTISLLKKMSIIGGDGTSTILQFQDFLDELLMT